MSVPVVVAAVTAGGPHRLVDGSTAPAVPAPLRHTGGRLVMTRARTGTVGRWRALVATCPGSSGARRSGAVVERIGVHGRGITFPAGSGEIIACDRDPRARAIYGPWCGGSAWRSERGRVGEPRLVICDDRQGRPVIAFAWIDPLPRARWIVVDQPGYREVYPVAARLPVRVSTASGITPSRGAVFRTAQYDGRGGLLRRRKVIAVIAG